MVCNELDCKDKSNDCVEKIRSDAKRLCDKWKSGRQGQAQGCKNTCQRLASWSRPYEVVDGPGRREICQEALWEEGCKKNKEECPRTCGQCKGVTPLTSYANQFFNCHHGLYNWDLFCHHPHCRDGDAERCPSKCGKCGFKKFCPADESCYGAKPAEHGCCKTCDDVKIAFYWKGWHFDHSKITQCSDPSGSFGGDSKVTTPIDCQQDEELCSVFEQYECDKYDFLKEDCPKLCGSCDPSKSKDPSIDCQDEEFCSGFDKDDCYGYIKENCPKLCGSCGKNCEDEDYACEFGLYPCDEEEGRKKCKKTCGQCNTGVTESGGPEPKEPPLPPVFIDPTFSE